MGAVDGVPDAVDRSELFGSVRPGGVGVRRGVRGGVVRRCSGNTERTTLGGNNVRFIVLFFFCSAKGVVC